MNSTNLRNRTFGQISGKVAKVQKSRESPEISKKCRNHKKCRNRQNRQNLEKSRFLALWLGPYVTCQNPQNLPESRFWPDPGSGWITVRTRKKCSPEVRKKCQKKCRFLRFFDPQKNRNFGLYAVGTTRRKWRHRALRGAKKMVDFQHFFGVKQKNVLFSGWMRDFVISRFFSKSRRFEGQCQSDLPKGSPSSPVIFHQGGNWKWSIYSTWNRLSGRSEPDSRSELGSVQNRGSGQIRARTWNLAGQPESWSEPGLARIAILARSWLGPGFWLDPWSEPESWNLARIATLAKSRDSARFQDFWIRPWILPDSCPDAIWALCVCVCAYRCWKLHTTPCTRCMSATCLPHVHIQIVSKANSCMCTFWKNTPSLFTNDVFCHSCALKIIFGISSRYEMLFRGCVWYGACD